MTNDATRSVEGNETLPASADLPEPDVPDVTLEFIESIVPHRGTMLLIDAVTAVSAEAVSVRATVRGETWYADADGAMPSWIGMEIMAQAIAAHIGVLARQAGAPPRMGVLLGSNHYQAHRDVFPYGALLLVHATALLRSDAGHGAYDCVIEHEGVRCAEAVIKVYQPDDFQSFIEESAKS